MHALKKKRSAFDQFASPQCSMFTTSCLLLCCETSKGLTGVTLFYDAMFQHVDIVHMLRKERSKVYSIVWFLVDLIVTQQIKAPNLVQRFLRICKIISEGMLP